MTPRAHKGYADQDVARFNAEVPVGTRVRYWPVLPARPNDEPFLTKTRSPAWPLGHGAGVVMVEGKTGGVAISHVEVVR